MRLDLTDPAFLADPGPVLARLRARGPLAEGHLPLVGRVRLTTTDAAARAVLKRTEDFARSTQTATGRPMARTFWWMPPSIRPLLSNVAQMDGDAHARLRGMIAGAFARTEIAPMRARLAAIADELLDALPSGPVDIRAAYAQPLPLRAICVLLGLPPAEERALASEVVRFSSVGGALEFLRAVPGLKRAQARLHAAFAQGPGPGLLHELTRGEAAAMTDEERVTMALALFVAGHETTVHLITACLARLVRHPHEAAPLREDARARGLYVEEVLRHHTPVLTTNVHYARRACEVEGAQVRRGERLMPLLIAANRDDARHDAPDAFVADRRPNAHLGFGHGPHVCVGMQLARLEADVALERILARAGTLEPAGEAPMMRRLGMRGYARLPVRLAPRRAAAAA